MQTPELSIVIPCLNEAATLSRCIARAREYLSRTGVAGEVVVADNGSTDGSRQLAIESGARVILVARKGYGAALQEGIRAAKGNFVIMGDADESYDFGHLDAFLERLREGYDLVMGNRFTGGIARGAMPALHRYLGNPVLSFLGRLFFPVRVGDFHCGLRGFKRCSVLNLNLTSTGMEFASEMVVKAALSGLRITEVPTNLYKDGRGRQSHLRTWRDGWRHLRFLLLFSPRWLFLYPGSLFLLTGALLQTLLFHGSIRLGGLGLDVHTMLYASALSVIGTQMVWFAVFVKVYAASAGLLPRDARLEQMLRTFSLERGLIIGAVLFLGGILLSASAVLSWAHVDYGALDPREVMRKTIPSVSMMLMGTEFIIASFFLGILRSQTTTSSQGVSTSNREFAEPTLSRES